MRTFSGTAASRVAIERHVRQRSRASQAPVFDRRVRVDHLRSLIGAIRGQDAIARAVRSGLLRDP